MDTSDQMSWSGTFWKYFGYHKSDRGGGGVGAGGVSFYIDYCFCLFFHWKLDVELLLKTFTF